MCSCPVSFIHTNIIRTQTCYNPEFKLTFCNPCILIATAHYYS